MIYYSDDIYFVIQITMTETKQKKMLIINKIDRHHNKKYTSL